MRRAARRDPAHGFRPAAFFGSGGVPRAVNATGDIAEPKRSPEIAMVHVFSLLDGFAGAPKESLHGARAATLAPVEFVLQACLGKRTRSQHEARHADDEEGTGTTARMQQNV